MTYIIPCSLPIPICFHRFPQHFHLSPCLCFRLCLLLTSCLCLRLCLCLCLSYLFPDADSVVVFVSYLLPVSVAVSVFVFVSSLLLNSVSVTISPLFYVSYFLPDFDSVFYFLSLSLSHLSFLSFFRRADSRGQWPSINLSGTQPYPQVISWPADRL